MTWSCEFEEESSSCCWRVPHLLDDVYVLMALAFNLYNYMGVANLKNKVLECPVTEENSGHSAAHQLE